MLNSTILVISSYPHLLGKLRRLSQDSLLQNSFFLMLTTAVMAVLGFVFWFICARLFLPSEIGEATSLISALSLISYMSLLGFNSTFIRILPTSVNRNNIINTGLWLSLSAAVLFATSYVLLIGRIAPSLASLLHTPWYAVGFIALVAFATVNLLTDTIFVAFRGARYNLLIDGGIMGCAKLLLPLMLISLGSYGIFLASGLAASVAMLASLTFLVVKFNYRPALTIHVPTLRTMFHYSFANYFANLLNIAPVLLLPLIVLNHLGAASAGYYYLAFTVANLLYAVVYAVSQSLFAEGSYDQSSLQHLLKRAAIIVAALIIPSALCLAFLGPLVLRVFGVSYGEAAKEALLVLAAASPVVAAYTLCTVVLRITHRMSALIVVNAVYLATICGLSWWWVDRGLAWVAAAWLIGNAAATLVGGIALIRANPAHVPAV